MRLFKIGKETIIDGEMNSGAIYILPKSSENWLEAHGVSDLRITGWKAVIAAGGNRFTRFLRLLPHVWAAAK